MKKYTKLTWKKKETVCVETNKLWNIEKRYNFCLDVLIATSQNYYLVFYDEAGFNLNITSQ